MDYILIGILIAIGFYIMPFVIRFVVIAGLAIIWLILKVYIDIEDIFKRIFKWMKLLKD